MAESTVPAKSSVERKKRATVEEAKKGVFRNIREGLMDYSGDGVPVSGVQIKLTLVLPCETYVLYRLSGKSYDKIAEIVGLSKFAVYRLAEAYQNMDPPFGGFEPLQINYLKKQLDTGRSLKDIANELNGALDNIQGISHEDTVAQESLNASAGSNTDSSSENWWDSSTPATVRRFDVSVQKFDSPVATAATDTVTLRITEQGLKYYINDFGLNILPEKSLADIIEFRRGRKNLPPKNGKPTPPFWKNIAEYYQETKIPLMNYIHQQVFPADLVAMYRLSGFSFADIIDTIPDEFQRLLALSEKRLQSVQTISYRNSPKYRVVPPAEILEMLPEGSPIEDIDDAIIKKIAKKYGRFLTASTVQLDRKTVRAKIFKATLTPEGLKNYMKDISKPSRAEKTAKRSSQSNPLADEEA